MRLRCAGIAAPVMALVAAASTAYAAVGGCDVVPMPGPAWDITNGIVHRAIRLSEDGPRTVWLGSDGEPTLQFEVSDEFLLRIEGGRELGLGDFTWSADTDQSPVADGLAFALEGIGKEQPLRIRLIYTVLPGQAWMRKQIALQNTGNREVVVRDVQVERAKVSHGNTDLGGLGQPVFVDNRAFWALEYPAAENRQADGLVTLEHHPGVRLKPDGDWWRSKTAVFGMRSGADVAEAFREYLAAIRRRPRSYVVYNSWYDLRGEKLTAETLAERARRIHEELTVKRGAPFDGVVIDDGWQDRRSIWEIDETNFPEGLEPLREALDPIGVSVDLWHPLTAVNGNLDADWGAANGYETAPGNRFFCLSGQRYNRALRNVMRRHVRKYDIDYFKHDFNIFACAADGHGHLPEATYGREANVDAEIEMFKFLDRVSPGIYLNPSGGMWLSPWWLMYVDTVWMRHCADFGYNKQALAYEPRDWAITYRDTALHSNLHGDRAQFPVSGIMTIGIIDGKLNRLGGKGEPLDRWANNVVVNMSRGSMLQELYITPDLLSDEQWGILASALKWQRQYVPQMASGRMLPVDPRWPDVYGWAHLNEEGGFVCLRNSGIVGRNTSVPLPELNAHAGRGGFSHSVTRIYPWRETLGLRRRDGAMWLETNVEPFGVTVIEITRGPDTPVASIGGPRRSIVDWKPGEVTYDVWGPPGSEERILVRGAEVKTAPKQRAELYDPEVSLWRVACSFPGERQRLWNVRELNEGRSFGVTVDEGVTWRFVVAAHGLHKSRSVRLLVDGEEIEANRVGGEGWEMFTCTLPKGTHDVAWAPEEGENLGPFSVRPYWVETYFVREAELVPVRVTVTCDEERYPPRQALETPCASIERSTWTGPKATVEPKRGPLNVAVSEEDLRSAKAAKLHISAFGSQGGEDYGRKWIVLNGQRIGAVPANSNAARPDVWEEFAVDLSPEQLGLLRAENEVVVETQTADCFKFSDLALAVQLADGRWAETEHAQGVWCNTPGWLYAQGRMFGERTPRIWLRFAK